MACRHRIFKAITQLALYSNYLAGYRFGASAQTTSGLSFGGIAASWANSASTSG